jgi:hypothetical protein
MFRCDFCKKTTKPYEKLHRQVTKVRNKQYPNESFGMEIVEEKRSCEPCYLDASDSEPEVVMDDAGL